MATIDNIVTRIARRLRRTATSGSNLQSEIIDELVHAQNKLEEGATLPWFLKHMEEEAVLANVDVIDTDGDLAASFIRFQDDRPVTYTDPTGVATEKVDLPQQSELLILFQRYPGTGLLPKEFTLDEDNILLRPIPTQAITYQVRMFRKDPTVPAEGTTTLWSINFSDLLMNLAGREIAWSLRDDVAQARFTEDLVVARREYIKSVAAREDAGQVHIMGDP